MVMGSSIATAQSLTAYDPTHAAFGYSDYCAVNVNSSRARFTRPTVDGQGFEYANPGARVRFRTDANRIRLNLRYTNLVTREDTYNSLASVLVDGTETVTFQRSKGTTTAWEVFLAFSSSTARNIDLVMPYCASLDFEGIEIPSGASLVASTTARPATRFVALGDSITHGFNATKTTASWPYLLANTMDWQLINHGYGGRQVATADGTAVGALSPDVVTILLGYNDFAAQTALATFEAAFEQLIANIRSAAPSIPIYCITPTWSDDTDTITLDDYRGAIEDALEDLADANNILVDGESLATNNLSHFPDGIHPTDAASIEIAAELADLM